MALAGPEPLSYGSHHGDQPIPPVGQGLVTELDARLKLLSGAKESFWKGRFLMVKKHPIEIRSKNHSARQFK